MIQAHHMYTCVTLVNVIFGSFYLFFPDNVLFVTKIHKPGTFIIPIEAQSEMDSSFLIYQFQIIINK